CALTYREAEAVFVTNVDNLAAARRLKIAEDRIVRLPHAVDSERIFRFADANRHIRPPDDHIRIFAPSRQDWVDGDRNWTKGSDRLLRGWRVARDRVLPIQLTDVSWGRDLAASRKLVQELELEEFVDWVPTLRKLALWASYLGSHAVADQFVLPGFGGVT